MSNVAALSGDLEQAIDAANVAGSLATDSGWLKGQCAAAANLGYLHLARGSYDDAERNLTAAKRISGNWIDYEIGLTVSSAQLAICRGDHRGADEILKKVAEVDSRVQPWYALGYELSVSRVAILQGRFAEAVHRATTALRLAERLRNGYYAALLELTAAEGRMLQSGKASETQLTFPAQWSPGELPLTVLGASRVVLARALRFEGLPDAAEVRRAALILSSTSDYAEWIGSTEATQKALQTKPDPDWKVSLDDGVALLELAGYPHVLAREAYALLETTGAADAFAIVARAADRVRVVSAHGWSPDEAARAAAKPDAEGRLRIVCGPNRDETWEIIADLRPSLADRCTAIAVRKLAETAATLDRYRREEKQRAALWPAGTLETDGGLWVSEQMTELLSIARRVATADITVLLTGETGTGKEVLARAIHRASARAQKPFVPFNCTAVPREMLESQLFGYRKGAFTGADAAFEGVIRGAAGGTLFLDEIAEIGPELQPKLLRFLETHEVHGLGEAQPVTVDVRVVAATNADLDALVAGGRFREDLYYRLNAVRLRLPPLRERREEIPPLVDLYLGRSCDELKKGRLTLNDETLEFLLLYGWPGNVRQLVNEMRRIAALAEPDSTVTPALLTPEIQSSRRTIRVGPDEEPEIRVRLDQPLDAAIEMIEQAMIRRALDRARGRYEDAAQLLGISRKGLFLKRRRLGLRKVS
jgi:DNA-binding NtrC family response regulator/tetratricopeptide (TPR) repeat protein